MRLIDADELTNELSTMYKQPKSTEDFMTIGYDHAIADTVVTVHKQPTVEERKTGRWIKLDMHRGMEQFKCSVCNSECYVPMCMDEPLYYYCPNCGAKMEVEHEYISG